MTERQTMSAQSIKTNTGLPLSQLSPERINGRSSQGVNMAIPFSLSSPIRKKEETSIFNTKLPASPSLPELSLVREHIRGNNDVSGLVKRFEHLDVRDRDAESPERKRRNDEALDRAKIAREEAETDAKKSREELRAQKKELEETKDRERRACKRIDVLMEEFARAKEQWTSQSSVYEKEIRKARKEAFKSSSAVLKLHEDSKSVKKELGAAQLKLDLAQRKAASSEDEKFTAQYQLAAVQEDLEQLQSTLRIVQEERETLKQSLKEEEVARIAAEGSIALPTANDHDLLDSPIRSRSPMKRYDSGEDKENINTADKQRMEAENLRRELHIEKRRRQAAEELAEFTQLECRFQCCSCAHSRKMEASNKSSSLTADQAHPRTDRASRSEMNATNSSLEVSSTIALPEDKPEIVNHPRNSIKMHTPEPEVESPSQHSNNIYAEPEASHDESSNHFLAEDQESHEHSQIHTQENVAPTEEMNLEEAMETDTQSHRGSFRMVTTTTKVPMLFSPAKKSPTEEKSIPILTPTEGEKAYPFDREAALAAIAYRRGRTKSFAQSVTTPKRPTVDLKERRDISAPAIAQ